MAKEAGIARQASSPMGEIATGVTGLSRASSLFSEINKPKPISKDPFAGKVPTRF